MGGREWGIGRKEGGWTTQGREERERGGDYVGREKRGKGRRKKSNVWKVATR